MKNEIILIQITFIHNTAHMVTNCHIKYNGLDSLLNGLQLNVAFRFSYNA